MYISVCNVHFMVARKIGFVAHDNIIIIQYRHIINAPPAAPSHFSVRPEYRFS